MFKQSIKQFSSHPVAANLLMALMLLSGVWALTRLNVQFLPHFDIEIVRVNVRWHGASSKDMIQSVINPIEQELKDLDFVKKINSVAQLGQGTIVIEFEQGTNMSKAAQDVRDRVKQVRNLPEDIEEPIITQLETYEIIAKLLLSGSGNLEELREIAYQFEEELLGLGISKVEILGLPKQEVRIEISSQSLANLKLSLGDIANIIRKQSHDLPAGIIGRDESAKQIRIESQARNLHSFENIAIIQNSQSTIRLKDIASHISMQAMPSETLVFQQGKPAIELRLLRTANMNAFTSAKIIDKLLKEVKTHFNGQIKIKLFDQKWRYIKERVQLLLKNGLGGLLLIIIVLYLFLNKTVSFWVVAGIPASFMAALAALYLNGGSIDMVSLFAFIMSLGIIVDDTIVVGEQALTNIQAQQTPIDAINNAAIKMLSPIASSSLTTISAFLPLFFISGIIGRILFAIPLVVICVIIASVIECFYILPGHLYHSFKHGISDIQYDKYQKIVSERFERFKKIQFTNALKLALKYRLFTFTAIIALLIVSIAFIALGYLRFNFFPSPEGQLVVANARFVTGTPEKTLQNFTHALDQALEKTVTHFQDNTLVHENIAYLKHHGIDERAQESGEHLASYLVELSSPETRDISNQDFIQEWQKHIQYPAGLEQLSITSPKGGPPGKDLDIQISGTDIPTLKRASEKIQAKLSTFPGIYAIKDDMPFGQEQLILSLTPTGLQNSLTLEDLGKQLNAAFSGELIQIYHDQHEEIEVRVMLPEKERNQLNHIETLLIKMPNGKFVPFGTVAQATPQPAPDVIKRTDGKLSIHVTAEVNQDQANSNEILSQLNQIFLPKLIQEEKVSIRFRGKAEEQADAFKDMKIGLMLGMILIYIILAWVFESYRLPLVVMSAIPLGLTGAILGHLLLGLDLTILSLFGLFGLSGIVINDSIILINEYRDLKAQQHRKKDAIILACQHRLRAVLLTSMTTVAGLTPLLFERSLQAQFLIPMATSISFGLIYATVIIMIFIPCLLYAVEKDFN